MMVAASTETLSLDGERFPALQRFVRALEDNAMLRQAVQSVATLHRKYGDAYLELGEQVLQLTHRLQLDPAEIFADYLFEYLKDRLRFESTGEYGNGGFEEIRARVYDSAEVMLETYLPGILLANVFSPLLHEKFQLLQRALLPQLDGRMRGVEVGFGAGFHLWAVLDRVAGSRVQGVDISPHAVEFTTRLLRAGDIDPQRYALEVADLRARLPLDEHAVDWCILTEVIEHVPDAAAALGEIHRILRPGGHLFLATVIDANHMDHILNFESPAEVAELLQSAGFAVEDQLVHAVADEAEGLTDRSVGLGFVCTRR